MQRHPKFELSSAQKAIETKYTTLALSVQGCRKTQVQSQIGENTKAKPLVYAYNIGNRGTVGNPLVHKRGIRERTGS